MSSFIQGLANRTAQGVDRRTNQMIQQRQTQQTLADEIARRKALQPQKLAEQQALFEQQQAQQLQAQPQSLQMAEEKFKFMDRIKKEAQAEADRKGWDINPELADALGSGNMAAIQEYARSGKMTQKDVDFMNLYKSLAKKERVPETAYDRTKGKLQAYKEMGVPMPGTGGGSRTDTPGADSKMATKRMRAARQKLKDLRSILKANETISKDEYGDEVKGNKLPPAQLKLIKDQISTIEQQLISGEDSAQGGSEKALSNVIQGLQAAFSGGSPEQKQKTKAEKVKAKAKPKKKKKAIPAQARGTTVVDIAKSFSGALQRSAKEDTAIPKRTYRR